MSEGELEESAEIAHDLIREQAAETHKAAIWVESTAMVTMVMALFSAVGALLAGITANEALIDRMEVIIDRSELDRDELELEVLQTRDAVHNVLAALGKTDIDRQSVESVKQRIEAEMDQEELAVEELNVQVENNLQAHELFAIAVTFLSVAITLCGMAVVSRWQPLARFGFMIGIAGAIIELFAVHRMLSG